MPSKKSYLIVLFVLSLAETLFGANEDIYQFENPADTSAKITTLIESKRRLESLTADNEYCKNDVALICPGKGPALSDCMLTARRMDRKFSLACSTYLHFKPSPSEPSQTKQSNVVR